MKKNVLILLSLLIFFGCAQFDTDDNQASNEAADEVPRDTDNIIDRNARVYDMIGEGEAFIRILDADGNIISEEIVQVESESGSVRGISHQPVTSLGYLYLTPDFMTGTTSSSQGCLTIVSNDINNVVMVGTSTVTLQPGQTLTYFSDNILPGTKIKTNFPSQVTAFNNDKYYIRSFSLPHKDHCGQQYRMPIFWTGLDEYHYLSIVAFNDNTEIQINGNIKYVLEENQAVCFQVDPISKIEAFDNTGGGAVKEIACYSFLNRKYYMRSATLTPLD